MTKHLNIFGTRLRLMKKPWGVGAGTDFVLQGLQPWVGNPSALSDEQLEVAAKLAAAADACEGTHGAATYIRRRPGRGKGASEPIPKIAKCVADIFTDQGWTVPIEEQMAKRREKAAEKRARKWEETERLFKERGIRIPRIAAGKGKKGARTAE